MTTATTTGADLVDRLLRQPDEVKLELAQLLEESVRDGFTSLAEGEAKQRAEIRRRIEVDIASTLPGRPADEVLADMKRMLEEYRQVRERYRG